MGCYRLLLYFLLLVGWLGNRESLALLVLIVAFFRRLKKTLINVLSLIKIVYIYIQDVLKITIWKIVKLTQSAVLYILFSTKCLLCLPKICRMGIDLKLKCKEMKHIRKKHKCNKQMCRDDFFGKKLSFYTDVSYLISPHYHAPVIVFLAENIMRLATFRPVCDLATGNSVSFVQIAEAGFRYIEPGACQCDGCGRRHNLSDFQSDPSDARYHSHNCTTTSGSGLEGNRVTQRQLTVFGELTLSESHMTLTDDLRLPPQAVPPFRFVWDDAQAEQPVRLGGHVYVQNSYDSSEDEQPGYSPLPDYSRYSVRLDTLVGLPPEYRDCVEIIAFNGFYQDDSEPCCFICYKCKCKWRRNIDVVRTGCLSSWCRRPTNPNVDPSLNLRMLQKENSILHQGMLCKLCGIRHRSVLFLPCGHLCICDFCSKSLRLCPVCNKCIILKMKTYS